MGSLTILYKEKWSFFQGQNFQSVQDVTPFWNSMKLKYAKISKNRFETLPVGRDSVRDKQRPSGNWKDPESGPYSNKSVELPF